MKDLFNIAKNNVFIFCLMSLILPMETIPKKSENTGDLIGGISKENILQTIYSHKGNPILQFKYKNEGQTYCTDCSVPEWAHKVDITNTMKRYLGIFIPACHQHDLNYRAPWRMAGFEGNEGKKIADKRFYSDMIQICKNTHDTTIGENYCTSVAIIWYNSVKYFGDESFEKGQAVAKKDCDVRSISLSKMGEI